MNLKRTALITAGCASSTTPRRRGCARIPWTPPKWSTLTVSGPCQDARRSWPTLVGGTPMALVGGKVLTGPCSSALAVSATVAPRVSRSARRNMQKGKGKSKGNDTGKGKGKGGGKSTGCAGGSEHPRPRDAVDVAAGHRFDGSMRDGAWDSFTASTTAPTRDSAFSWVSASSSGNEAWRAQARRLALDRT